MRQGAASLLGYHRAPVDEVEIEVAGPGGGAPDALALVLPEDDSTPRSDADLHGQLQQLADDGELHGELGRTVLLHTNGGSTARRVDVRALADAGSTTSAERSPGRSTTPSRSH